MPYISNYDRERSLPCIFNDLTINNRQKRYVTLKFASVHFHSLIDYVSPTIRKYQSITLNDHLFLVAPQLMAYYFEHYKAQNYQKLH